jgi:hypothetical protein
MCKASHLERFREGIAVATVYGNITRKEREEELIMASKGRDESRLEQGQRDTRIRRDTAVRGSMGTPASGRDTQKVTPETDVFRDESESKADREQMRRKSEEKQPKQPGRPPLLG